MKFKCKNQSLLIFEKSRNIGLCIITLNWAFLTLKQFIIIGSTYANMFVMEWLLMHV
jgi:hypothetical protein